jgi:hypothetical protein
MIFCGQCGLQLAPGTATCPRCGATVEEPKANVDALHANDSTVAGHSIPHPSQPGPITPPSTHPQQLILRPGTPTSSYNPQDATSMIDASTYGTNLPPGQPMPTQYPAGGHYPTQTSYPNYNIPGGTYAPAGMYAPGMTSQMGYPPQNISQGNPALRISGLIITIFGIVMMLSAVILFILQQNGIL